jgi:transcriptional regulator with XRE-family HTH domain
MAASNDDHDTPGTTRGDLRADLRGDLRRQIREFLRTRRAKLSPEQAGLPVYGGDRRRVSGLRREEVALLAGISSEYYTRLERGNATGVSEGVIDAIAHALQLDDAERAHLLDLLRSAGTTRPPARRPARPRVRPTVQRVLDSMVGTPAFVVNARQDLLAANALGRALYAPIYADPVRPPNTARFIFLDPHATELFCDWDKVANDIVALLRAEAGRDPYDRQLSDLIGELSTRSNEFRGRWGSPQRPDPHQRPEAPPPPGGRGPGAGVRVLPAGRRSQPEPAHLHRRAGIALPACPAPAGQLGCDHRRHRAAGIDRRLRAGCVGRDARLTMPTWTSDGQPRRRVRVLGSARLTTSNTGATP